MNYHQNLNKNFEFNKIKLKKLSNNNIYKY